MRIISRGVPAIYRTPSLIIMGMVSAEDFLAADLDYLVIGGGTAGLVVAARLTEGPTCVVGVLEAGQYHKDDPNVNVPGFLSRNMGNPERDWAFSVVPREITKNRKLVQNRGKGLGGSSSLNFMVSVRPTGKEIDALEGLGNPGWNWESVWKYMRKPPDLTKEDAESRGVAPNAAFHGTEGPIAKSFATMMSHTHSVFMDALEKLGVPRNPDAGGGNTIGSLLVPVSIDKGTKTRSYAANAYYAPNAQRPNLLVFTGAHVTKIILEPSRQGLHRAIGAEFVENGQTHVVHSSKEVILSCGSIQSPQVLELSGIGNKDILERHGINCVIDLPGVGENLQDHAGVGASAEVDMSIETYDKLHDPAVANEHLELYKQKKGLFTSMPVNFTAFAPASAFASKEDIEKWKTLARLEASSPDVFAHTPESVKRGLRKQYDLLRQWVDDPTAAMAQFFGAAMLNLSPTGLTADFSPTKRHFSLRGLYTHPFSRGSVHINSSSPFEQPTIKQNYLTNPVDEEILIRLLQFCFKLYETSPVKEVVVERIIPPGEPTEDDLKEYVRETVETIWHPVGTCAMTPKDDGGVVDHKLLVYGTENLRVIDCSILPLEVSCNTQTLAYAIGEKGADILKGIV
ncbi:unnamed protein product [Somion occarium]|uniref:Glucose-methanol-choline oxidoreductase N-terminal domain-containing protein n=1 Tax=Somion occarium TaxID=3059160 RepID=A0ABP1DG33_9APHY